MEIERHQQEGRKEDTPLNFITLTIVEGGKLLAVRAGDVRVVEATDYKKFEDGEWKETPESVTLVKLAGGDSYTVTEQAADILKRLETI